MDENAPNELNLTGIGSPLHMILAMYLSAETFSHDNFFLPLLLTEVVKYGYMIVL